MNLNLHLVMKIEKHGKSEMKVYIKATDHKVTLTRVARGSVPLGGFIYQNSHAATFYLIW